MNPPGIILFAHGSRDPQWREPIESVGELIRKRDPDAAVRCAYLELCNPSLPEAAASLVAGGARSITVFPIFFGVGKHAREDLPALIEQLQTSHPAIVVELLPAAGEHASVIELLARIALAGPSASSPSSG